MPCGWGVKAGMVRVRVAGKTVWSPCYTRPYLSALEVRHDEALYKSTFTLRLLTYCSCIRWQMTSWKLLNWMITGHPSKCCTECQSIGGEQRMYTVKTEVEHVCLYVDGLPVLLYNVQQLLTFSLLWDLLPWSCQFYSYSIRPASQYVLDQLVHTALQIRWPEGWCTAPGYDKPSTQRIM